MLKISHAAGHALVTPGKQDPEGVKEWWYNDKIVQYVMELLANYEGVEQKRFDDVTGKTDISLTTRSNRINAWGADIHIDYHQNAYGVGWTSPGGIETYTYTSKPKDAVALATRVQTNLVLNLGFADRGVKSADFHMLRATNMTAILIEFSFMTNKAEAYKMRTDEYQKKAAQAVVDALVSHYKLKRKSKAVVHVVKSNTNEPSSWAKKDWEEAVANGYFDGTRPKDNITREEMAIVVNRLRKNFKEGN
jgi:N-acetylmuramoyl-L-alanine amidase